MVNDSNTPHGGEPAPNSADGVRDNLIVIFANDKEVVPESAGLTRFKAQYESPKFMHKERCTWQEAERRLTENDSHFLKLAEAMNGGGVLFGVDKNGKLLFADAGAEPIMTDMSYSDTRNAVMFKEEEGKKIPTGYELFPYFRESKSDEILAYEDFTDDMFVRSEDGKEWRGSWLESGENPDWPKLAYLDPLNNDRVRVRTELKHHSNPELGVRRLLRV